MKLLVRASSATLAMWLLVYLVLAISAFAQGFHQATVGPYGYIVNASGTPYDHMMEPSLGAFALGSLVAELLPYLVVPVMLAGAVALGLQWRTLARRERSIHLAIQVALVAASVLAVAVSHYAVSMFLCFHIDGGCDIPGAW